MIQIDGHAYDGRSSERLSAILTLTTGGNLELSVPARGLIVRASLAETRISERLGNTPRKIAFPEGESFHTNENDVIDSFIEQHGLSNNAAWLHKLESKYRYVVIAVIVTVLASWLTVTRGLPATVNWVAHQLPADILDTTGKQTLQLLDKVALKESQLKPERREQLKQLFADTAPQQAERETVQVLFRDGGSFGANAFALPDGTILFTDQLVNKACTDEELLAIYGHEVGHLVNRHSLRHTIQGSAVALALALIIGDASAMGELLVAVPSLLLELSFSREFELEADEFSRQYLEEHQIPLYHFSSILARISGEEEPEGESGASTFFSTHPGTPERIAKFGEPRHCEAQ